MNVDESDNLDDLDLDEISYIEDEVFDSSEVVGNAATNKQMFSQNKVSKEAML